MKRVNRAQLGNICNIKIYEYLWNEMLRIFFVSFLCVLIFLLIKTFRFASEVKEKFIFKVVNAVFGYWFPVHYSFITN